MFKTILLTFLLLTTTLLANDARLNHYSGAMQWEKDANSNADSAYNLGHTYQTKIKDYDKAIYWYKKSYEIDKNNEAVNNLASLYVELKDYNNAIIWYKKAIAKGHAKSAYNLAYVYDENLKEYPNAIKYYTKAYKMGDTGGANSLGYLYEYNLKDEKNAELWYKKAVAKNNKRAIGNLAKLYKQQNKKELGSAYMVSLINNGYTKSKVLTHLKTKWNLTDEEIKKAYELQLKLDIPKHYRGGIN